MAEFREEIATLNGLSDSEASNEFLRCCGSRKWAENFCRQRPFASLEELLDTANTLWWASSVEDWFEAFSAHPKIGLQLCGYFLVIHSFLLSESIMQEMERH